MVGNYKLHESLPSPLTEEEFFSTLFTQMKPRLLAIANGILGKHQRAVQAVDILHDVFELALKKEQFRSMSQRHIEGWLITATKHRCINYLSSKGSKHEEIENESSLLNGRNVESVINHIEFSDYANHVLNLLKDRQRQVFIRFINGEELSEIAENLDLGLSNVKYHLYRAKKALQEYATKLNTRI